MRLRHHGQSVRQARHIKAPAGNPVKVLAPGGSLASVALRVVVAADAIAGQLTFARYDGMAVLWRHSAEGANHSTMIRSRTTPANQAASSSLVQTTTQPGSAVDLLVPGIARGWASGHYQTRLLLSEQSCASSATRCWASARNS